MTTDELLNMYAMGLFPMAEYREDDGFDFFAPHTRALLPISQLHVPRRLRRKALQYPFVIKVDMAFTEVINACANVRDATWINNDIIAQYNQLHMDGFAHSVECWQEGKLVGGLYGVSLGGTFCGESMFSHVSDASKIALIHLCARLSRGGYIQLDSQFRNPHLDQFGLYEIPQDDYIAKMQNHLSDAPLFIQKDYDERKSVEHFLQHAL